jgi:hypothetical protein
VATGQTPQGVLEGVLNPCLSTGSAKHIWGCLAPPSTPLATALRLSRNVNEMCVNSIPNSTPTPKLFSPIGGAAVATNFSDVHAITGL